jgi:16S rRNA (cytosine1402-N4)-methyltransferase
MEYQHIPVMLKEVIEYLKPAAGMKFIDCTLGGGGYTLELSKTLGSKGLVIGIDEDPFSIKTVKEKINTQKINNIFLSNDNFKNLSKIIKESNKEESIGFDGIVFDLGLSSAQLKDRGRGFSFQLDQAPLVMDFGGITEEDSSKTEKIVNKYKEEELERIFRNYGEERFSKNIARNIIKYRKTKQVKTVGELVPIIMDSIPGRFKNGAKIHPATRVFQALRIATNDELESLNSALPQALDLLKKGGRIAVISYHSLEDRIVKNFFKYESKDCVCPPEIPVCRCGHLRSLKIITKKALKPSEEEIIENPRSRSAKMRVAEKVS